MIIESILFNQLEITEEIKKAVTDMGFEETTPIQTKAIPVILEGKDVIAQAPTGTGKTCAFGIPAIEAIQTDNDKVQVLILCPTRELVIQTSEELKSLYKYKEGVRALPIYGGQQIDRQILALKKRPQIIIGTPGRVMDHLRRKTLKFEHLNMIVLDEADEMLNMGFREDIDIILESVPEERQFVLFSATLPKAIMDIANKYQKDAVKINVVHKVMTVPTVEQFYLETRESSKVEVLSRIIDANNFKLSVVFCNTKKRVDDLCKDLQTRGYSAEALHGDMKQLQRDNVMGRFRSGLIDILIATDVAARGIDVDDIDAVFNYDVPSDEEYYVHRIGRTGRAKREGVSYTFAAGRELSKLRDIQKYTKSKIKLIKPPTIEDIKENKLSGILDEVKDVLEQGKLTKYVKYIEQMLDELGDVSQDNYATSLELAAAFLKMTMKKTIMGSSKDVKPEDLSSGMSASIDAYEGNMVRLFINVGKKDNLQINDLVKFIASNTNIEGKSIGKVDMLDKFSFFEIPKTHLGEAMSNLIDQTLKGRKVNLEVANKKQGGRGGRSSQGGSQGSGNKSYSRR
ncbi:DEAD/DEAH box helicase [Cellulosilyticum sp. I15G10I2]|uniref:DEAD/DEAH box helicase n=1 Tax=Cellulosilyticum sp. I15G10I2 TaxID=1892843 RepID=UPI000B196B17|nr:DEAD/DEAH box helicase [Cellulosilyticum sp. I15G10I2]